MSRHRIATARCVMTHRQDPDRPRPALPGLLICGGHRIELYRLVDELPDRYDGMDRAHGAPGRRTGRGPGGGIPIDTAVADHRSHMAAVVASWCALIADERGVRPPAGHDIAQTAPWLARHVEWAAAQPWVDELVIELRQITGQALALADLPARWVPLAAQCLTHTGGQRCEGTVTIVIRGDDWTARCVTCDTVQDVGPYLRGVRSGKWITCQGVIMLARLCGLPCSPEVVRQWHHRRRIVGQRQKDGSVLYGLASVQAYLTKRQRPAIARASLRS